MLCQLLIGQDERELQRREEKIGHSCLWSHRVVVRLSDMKRERKGESGPQLPDLHRPDMGVFIFKTEAIRDKYFYEQKKKCEGT